MDEDLNKIQTISANSNLVATAEEFVPKSLSNLRKSSNILQNIEQNSFEPNSCNANVFQFLNSFRNHHETENAKQYHSVLSEPQSSHHLMVGEHSVPSGNINKSMSKKKNLFFSDRKDTNYVKYNQYRQNSKWKNGNHGNQLNSNNFFDADKIKYHYSQNFVEKNKPSEIPKTGNQYFVTEEETIKNKNWYAQAGYPGSSFTNNKRSSWRNQDNLAKFKLKSKTNNDQADRPNQFYLSSTENYNQTKAKMTESNRKSLESSQNKYMKYKRTKEKKTDHQFNQKTSQREQLINSLSKGVLECLVCCETIGQNMSIWSCNNCYHVLHLKCVIKWAKSSKNDFGWRCPACQNLSKDIPDVYYCFCGKTRNPEWNHQDCPHSCGEVCGKALRKSCPHKCTLLCHPGPCPHCTSTVSKTCGCGKTKKIVQCNGSDTVTCEEKCEKELNCLIHTCTKKCHLGECLECTEVIHQDCYCQKSHRDVKCTIEFLGISNFSCGNTCEKKLNCGNHSCKNICHEGNCTKCELMPEVVKFCSCGKTELNLLQTTVRSCCTDPIPTCDLICGKNLNCGPSDEYHTCKKKCHEGLCPVCSLESIVKCRCGHLKKMIPCSELNTLPNGVLCDKRCAKKRNCGKHKCNQICCTDTEHKCNLPCNRFLQCGIHRCEETCHKGHCKPCLRASFDEFTCECGAEVIFPPVPCGTRRPQCDKPCSRVHPCGHPPVHSCHSADQCPPCTVLTKKYCHGRHELRKAVPCHQDSFSCGLPCGKELPCKKHKCILPCHSGPCLKQGQSCTQACTLPRSLCGHYCGIPCHEGPCSSDVVCKEEVKVSCECGHRVTTKICHENFKESLKIWAVKSGKKIDTHDFDTNDFTEVVNSNKKLLYNNLECNDECKLIERNRRLALALQIKNPDLSAKLTPRYSEYLKTWAKRDPRFCQMIHEKLTDLVQLAKQSKQKSRSYSFDSMNREKRHFIHEYCEHFGCESMAYDKEPKRNVVATALKDKSWLPSVSIIEFVRKENSPRKVPMPVITKSVISTPQKGMELLSSKLSTVHSQQSISGEGSSLIVSSEPHVDYFDWRPQK